MTTLAWDGCVNVRDLGGLPTEDGGEIRRGALVRADSLRNLTERGWEALAADGVRRIVDLRWPEELEREGYEAAIEVVHISLLGDAPDEEYFATFRARTDLGDEPARWLGQHYVDILELHTAAVARAVEAVATAPEGAVCVHCAGGKDRTGVVVALLLRLAGVPAARIAEDYALSGPNLMTKWDPRPWIEEASDPDERRWREMLTTTPGEAMLRMLEELDRRWGGARAYLVRAGVDEAQLDAIVERLRGAA